MKEKMRDLSQVFGKCIGNVIVLASNNLILGNHDFISNTFLEDSDPNF